MQLRASPPGRPRLAVGGALCRTASVVAEGGDPAGHRFPADSRDLVVFGQEPSADGHPAGQLERAPSRTSRSTASGLDVGDPGRGGDHGGQRCRELGTSVRPIVSSGGRPRERWSVSRQWLLGLDIAATLAANDLDVGGIHSADECGRKTLVRRGAHLSRIRP